MVRHGTCEVQAMLQMRISPVSALATAVLLMLAPGLGVADPLQPQSQPTIVVPPTIAVTPVPVRDHEAPGSAAVPRSPNPGETVIVTGAGQTNDVSAHLDRVECRIDTPHTDTRFAGPRVCATVRAWDDRQKKSQRGLDMFLMEGHAYF
jgi:hypothetical protein